MGLGGSVGTASDRNSSMGRVLDRDSTVGRTSDRDSLAGSASDSDSLAGRASDRDSSVGRASERDSSVGRASGRDSSVGRSSDRKARRNTDAGSIPRRGKRDFSPRVDFKCRLSCGVRTAPVCSRMQQKICARQKSETLTTVALLGHTKILW